MMRLPGRIEPGRGGGDAGHFASCFLPKATADANVTESCFIRPGRSVGVAVSGPAETEGGTTMGFAAAESLPLPLPGGPASGAVSRAAHDIAVEIAHNTNTRRKCPFIMPKVTLGSSVFVARAAHGAGIMPPA